MPRPKNKVALVPGAARGIGAAICRALADEGAQVVVTGATVQALDTHGRLDVLVNNAGISGFENGVVPQDPEHASLESWHAVHRTSLSKSSQMWIPEPAGR